MSAARPAEPLHIVGRSIELARIRESLETSRRDAVPRTIRIEGDPGIGKSAVLRRGNADAQNDGWIVGSATCYEVQARLPFAALKRVLRSLVAALGEKMTTYGAGLESLLGSEASETQTSLAMLRLLEGVTLDGPVLIALDDAQWADRDSLQALDEVFNALPDRPLAIVIATRRGAPAPELRRMTERVELSPLKGHDAADLLRSVAPAATSRIVDAIVEHARGYPLDLITLGEAIARDGVTSESEIASSLRGFIAEKVRSAPAEVREFLQICALLGDRVEMPLLRQLWPNIELLESSIVAAAPYLRQTDQGVEFVHALIADAVRHTVAVAVPFRRRIIDAIKALGTQSIERLQLLAGQLAACGETSEAFRITALRASEAADAADLRLAVELAATALTYGDPPDDDAVAFFNTYANSLFHLNRDAEAIAVLEPFFARLNGAGRPIPGSLVARWYIASRNVSETGAEPYEKYLSQITDEVERAEVESAVLVRLVNDVDPDGFERAENALLTLGERLPNTARYRLTAHKAVLLCLTGNHAAAASLIDEARTRYPEAAADLDPLKIGSLWVNLYQYGTRAIDRFLESARDVAGTEVATIELCRVLNDFVAGRLDAADLAVAEMLDTGIQSSSRAKLLAFATAVGALRERPSQLQGAIETEVTAYLGGQRGYWLDVLVAWWIAQAAKSDRKTASTLLKQLVANGKQNLPHFSSYMLKIGLVAAAHRLGDEETLRILARECAPRCQTPWHLAHYRAARAIAGSLAGIHDDAGARAAMSDCENLGLTLYRDLIACTAGAPVERERALKRLRDLDVRWLTGAALPGSHEKDRPTPRELQVAQQVALGKSNTEIAAALVLSHRTVEAHLSNLFGKLALSSRTQLASWYLRNFDTA
jgi:DNA-binding CsgD family transcriptional regulator